MKAISKVFLAAFFAGITLVAAGFRQRAEASALYDVFLEQTVGQGDFGTTPIATISDFDTSGVSLTDFYQYANFKFNNSSVALKANTTRMFLARDQNKIGLFVVHDVGNAALDSDGGYVAMEGTLTQSNSASFLVVDDALDDPYNITPGSASKTQNFIVEQGWGSGFTDGFSIGDLANLSSTNWSATIKFLPIASSRGITNWEVLSADGTSTNLLESFTNSDPFAASNVGRSVQIRPSVNIPSASTIPEPSILGGLALIVGIGGISRLRMSAFK